MRHHSNIKAKTLKAIIKQHSAQAKAGIHLTEPQSNYQALKKNFVSEEEYCPAKVNDLIK